MSALFMTSLMSAPSEQTRRATNASAKPVWILIVLESERRANLQNPRQDDRRRNQIARAFPQIPSRDEIGVEHVEEIGPRLNTPAPAQRKLPGESDARQVRIGKRNAPDRL